MARDYTLCMRCGEQGPHYVPPGGGTTGFFYCDPDDKPESTWGPGPTQRRYIIPEIEENCAVPEGL